jgi:hypothetical protein
VKAMECRVYLLNEEMTNSLKFDILGITKNLFCKLGWIGFRR